MQVPAGRTGIVCTDTTDFSAMVPTAILRSSTPSTCVLSRSSASHDFLSCQLPGGYHQGYYEYYGTRVPGPRYLVPVQVKSTSTRYEGVSCSRRELNTCVAIFAWCGLGGPCFTSSSCPRFDGPSSSLKYRVIGFFAKQLYSILLVYRH